MSDDIESTIQNSCLPNKPHLNTMKWKCRAPCGGSLAKQSEQSMLNHVQACLNCSAVPGLSEHVAEWKRKENKKSNECSGKWYAMKKGQTAAQNVE